MYNLSTMQYTKKNYYLNVIANANVLLSTTSKPSHTYNWAYHNKQNMQ